jgi:hypothetical protein
MNKSWWTWLGPALNTRAIRCACLCMGLVAVFSLAGWAPALANDDEDEPGWTKTVEVYPLETVAINECNNGEAVQFAGEARFVTKTRPAQQGGLDVKQTVRIKGTGFGLVSGATYHFKEDAVIRIFDGMPLPFSYTEARTQDLIGQGSIPNQTITYFIHFFIDANENVITDIFEFDLVCHP